MKTEEPFYENKKFITLVMVVAVALALFAMFSTTTVGQAWLVTIARGIIP
ncbi:MAG: hypothetical protein PHC66_02705 [Candidatus Nanoarchaeia archaeon]|nr:hypothetical protein [Candidatus Nanoarchaeia archaeon]MDD5239398.1 hypothetical protein [Candidatus Nanoarchaeia archaeon]